MKKTLLLACCFAIFIAGDAQEIPEDQIREYWFVLLVKGDNHSQDSATASQIQAGHMANITSCMKREKSK